jgi:hypothetical protein
MGTSLKAGAVGLLNLDVVAAKKISAGFVGEMRRSSPVKTEM